jgi:uncharacterized membrane protein
MRKNLEVIGLAALALLVWITYSALYGPNPLPGRIPTHFDFAGNPNGWGSPTALLLFPAVAATIYLAMTILARFPSTFSYPVTVTTENRPRLQKLTLSMVAWLKVELVCLFAWIQWSIVAAARHGHSGLSLALIPVSILVILGTVVWFIVALLRAGQAAAAA